MNPTIQTYRNHSHIIMYVMRMFGKRNMHTYVNHMFRLLYDKLKDTYLNNEINAYISELGTIRSIRNKTKYGTSLFVLVVDGLCIPERIYVNDHRAKRKIHKKQQRNNAEVYWNSIPVKTQVKIVNHLFDKYISQNKWVFKEINTILNIDTLINNIKYFNSEGSQFANYSELAVWKIWKNAIQDNMNNMQRWALIYILSTVQSAIPLNQRIRSIGKIIRIYDKGINNFYVDYYNKSILVSAPIESFSVKQRKLIVDHIVIKYIRQHKNIFDKFIKNPAVSLLKIANGNQ